MEMVPLLELPDALAGVAAVAPGRDRPQGVGRLHDVAALRPCPARGVGDDAEDEDAQNQHDEELSEHVFDMLRRTRVRVKPYFFFGFGPFPGLVPGVGVVAVAVVVVTGAGVVTPAGVQFTNPLVQAPRPAFQSGASWV